MGKEYTRIFSINGLSPFYGDQIHLEDWTIKPFFQVTADGSDYTADRSIARTFCSKPTFHLATRTTGAADNDHVRIDTYLPPAKSPFCRIQLAFLSSHISTVKYIDFYFIFYTGALAKDARIRYNSAFQKWQYWSDAAAWADITGFSYVINDNTWNFIELTLDLTNYTYLSFSHNQRSIDLSSLSLHSSAVATGSTIYHIIDLTATATAPANLYLGPILLTNT